MWMSAGTLLMTGGVVSPGGGAESRMTVTSKLPVTVWPPESATEQPTVVVPTLNVEPEAGVQVGVSAPSS